MDAPINDIKHKGDVPWYRAKLPRRWHRCRVQTEGWLQDFTLVQRCACGGIRLNGTSGRWLERNQRRRAT